MQHETDRSTAQCAKAPDERFIGGRAEGTGKDFSQGMVIGNNNKNEV
jgi:hypothetical protein